MIFVCPVCRGFEDRPDDPCGMCSDPGCSIPGELCMHERYEQYNEGCDCDPLPCERCGASLNFDEDPCWQCGA